ncbi:hypothetical protein GYMLUDRAFT_253351 [Collybiopsis luxurians FD-317 M1]|uniref:Uncharacterized protein n=1 Tax=Collybiopsis luxurians FD-317 M1 TaxID=944289 RepID=A0A0D0C5N6_9AGAR|nr:hypothetical protein GYMLUDRAFT_253351 [Collybiopsis luxurians FD-317 M1]
MPPDRLLCYLAFPDLRSLSVVSSTCNVHVRAFHLRAFRPDNVLRSFFALSDIPSFMDLLSFTGCIVSGSVASKFFSRECYDSDLDLFCSLSWCGSVGTWLLAHGFIFCPTDTQDDFFTVAFARVVTASLSVSPASSTSSDYDSTDIVHAWYFSAPDGTRPVQLMATLYSPVCAVLSFHSKSVQASRECQKKAWPAHKPTCERNRNNQANWSSERHLATSALRKFVVKHRPSIAKAALEAFRLQSKPQQALHNFLAIYVTDRRRLFPGSRAHRETAFYVTGAEVREIGQAGSVKDVLQDEVVRINIVARKKGMKGSVSAY